MWVWGAAVDGGMIEALPEFGGMLVVLGDGWISLKIRVCYAFSGRNMFSIFEKPCPTYTEYLFYQIR